MISLFILIHRNTSSYICAEHYLLVETQAIPHVNSYQTMETTIP
jgi:hypothetical protein